MTASSDLNRLIYYSHYADGFPADDAGQDAQIADMVAASVRNNERDGLTGLLLAHQRSFLQVLEGTLTPLMACFERIESDTRHASVTLIGVEPIAQRQFANWTMCARRLNPTDDVIVATLNLRGRFVPSQLTMEKAHTMLLAVKVIQAR